MPKANPPKSGAVPKKDDNKILIIVLIVIGVLVLLSIGSCIACGACGTCVSSWPYY